MFSEPLLLFVICTAIVLHHPGLAEPQTIFEAFPQWILLVVLLGTATIGTILVASVIRQIPPRWWCSLLWSGGTFILSLIAIYAVMRLCEPRSLPGTVPLGFELVWVIASQLFFVIATVAAAVAKLASR